MTGDGDRDCKSRQRIALASVDSLPAEPPRKREEPHAPELRPHTEAAPRVASVLVAISRGTDKEWRKDGSDSGDPAVPTEKPGAQIHTDRPQREQQVQAPVVDVRCPEDGRYERSDNVREALVVKELSGTKAQIRKPST